MARRRLAVALLVPQPLATEIEGIRRACGDPRRGRIAPHITLVPPVNLPEGDVAEALAVVRRTAERTAPLHVVFGAPSTFAPTTRLAWLPVTGDLDALAELRRTLDTGPWARPADRPFVPHVTISAKVDDSRLRAILTALADFDAAVTIGRLHVLQNRQLPDGRWGWQPLVDAAFGRRPAVVGVGGLAVELLVGESLDPEAERLVSGSENWGGRRLAITARRDQTVVGAATGEVDGHLGRLERLMVAREHQHQGIGSHLLARFVAEVADAGCDLVVHSGPVGSAIWNLCRRRGWAPPPPDSGASALLLVRTLTSTRARKEILR